MTTMTALPALAYQVKNDLKPGPLEGLSEKMIDQHWMLYKGYVTNVNLLNQTVRDCLDSGGQLNEPRMAEVQRRLGFEYNGMILHEYYFGSLAKGSRSLSQSSDLHKKLNEDFGGFDRWRKQFVEIGKMRGVGWAITYLDPFCQRLVTAWVSDHEVGHIAGFIPIVVMDVWEHAFVTDYGNSAEGRGQYIEAFFGNLDWDVIAERYSLAAQSKIACREKTV